jgi:hypothetical protein
MRGKQKVGMQFPAFCLPYDMIEQARDKNGAKRSGYL